MSGGMEEQYYYDPIRDENQTTKNRINLTSSSSEATNYSAQTQKDAQAQKNTPFQLQQISRENMRKLGSVGRSQHGDPIGSYRESLSYDSPIVTKYAQDQILKYVSLISYETMSEQHYNMDVLDTSKGITAQAGAGIDAVKQANDRSPQEVLTILSGKAEGKLTCIDAANTVKSVLDQAGVENARIMTNIGVNHALNIMKLGEEYIVMSVDHPGATPTIVRGKTPQDALDGYANHIHGKRGKLDSGKITFQDDQGNPIGIYRTEARKALEHQMGSDTKPLERSIAHLNGQEGVHITAGTTQVGKEVIAGGSAQWRGTLVGTNKTRIRMDAQLGAATIVSPKQDPVGATVAASVGAHIDHRILGSRGADQELIGFANARISADIAIDPNIGINMPDIQGGLSAGAVYAKKLGEGSVRATAQVNALYGTPTNHQSFGARYNGWDASLGYGTPQAHIGVRGGVSKSEGSKTIGVDARHQFTDNLSATGGIEQETQNLGGLNTIKTLSANAGLEYKPTNSQVSYFANLNHTKTDQQDRGNIGGAIGMNIKF